MNVRKFHSLICIECLTTLVNPKVGDCFLTGKQMIAQKDIKAIGQDISWYEVTRVDGKGDFSYSPRYGKLIGKMEE